MVDGSAIWSQRPVENAIGGYFHKVDAWAGFITLIWNDSLAASMLTGTSTDDKYDATILPAYVSDAENGVFVVGAEISMEFYMPTAATTATDGPDTSTGDRLNMGDVV